MVQIPGNDVVLMGSFRCTSLGMRSSNVFLKANEIFFFVSVCTFSIKPLKVLLLNPVGRRMRQTAAFISCRITILSDRNTRSLIPVSCHALHLHLVHTFPSQKVNEYFEGRSCLEDQADCLQKHEVWFGI